MTADEHPEVDEKIISALDHATAAVADPSHDAVMDAARSARDRHVDRRRRRARVVASSTAAAVLVVAIGIAVFLTGDGSGHRQVASEGSADSGATTAEAPAAASLMVNPATGLADGDTVTVSGIGHVVPHGATVDSTVVAQCVVVDTTTHLVCADDVLDSSDDQDRRPPDEVDMAVADPIAPTFELRTDTPGETTIRDWTDQARLSCDAGAESVAPAMPDNPTTPQGADLDGPVSSDADAGSSSALPAPAGGCVVVVFDRDDSMLWAIAPIVFGDDAPTNPGTARGNAGAPGAPDEPSTGPGIGADSPWPPVPDGCSAPEYEPPVFGSDAAVNDELVDFAPTTATLCTYEVTGGGERRTIDDAGELARIRDDLNALAPAPGQLACTDEMGPVYGLFLEGDEQRLTVWVQHYGCGKVFTDDQVRIGAQSLDWL